MHRLGFVLLLSVVLGACELVGDVFQAGFVAGVIIMVLIVAAVLWRFKN